MAEVNALNPRIEAIEAKNTLAYGDSSLSAIAYPNRRASSVAPGPKMLSAKPSAPAVHTEESAEASNLRGDFAGWMNAGLTRVESGRKLSPAMEAAAPSGPISVGTGAGLDSIGFTVPTEVLPHLASYYALDSFGLAGATVIQTDHLHPMNKPVISAGAPDAVYGENAAPTGSQPFGLVDSPSKAQSILGGYLPVMSL